MVSCLIGKVPICKIVVCRFKSYTDLKYGYGEMVSLRSPKPQFRVRILVSVLNGGYSSVGRAKGCGPLCREFDPH